MGLSWMEKAEGFTEQNRFADPRNPLLYPFHYYQKDKDIYSVFRMTEKERLSVFRNLDAFIKANIRGGVFFQKIEDSKMDIIWKIDTERKNVFVAICKANDEGGN